MANSGGSIRKSKMYSSSVGSCISPDTLDNSDNFPLIPRGRIYFAPPLLELKKAVVGCVVKGADSKRDFPLFQHIL
jgi:hypothetical protein